MKTMLFKKSQSLTVKRRRFLQSSLVSALAQTFEDELVSC